MGAQQQRMSWPLTPGQVEALDLMLQTLFRRPAASGHTSIAGTGIAIATSGTNDTISSTLTSSVVVQVVNTITGAKATGTTVIPLDDTIPQNTEGIEFMTLAITPHNSLNRLKIEVVVQLSHSVANTWLTAALFQDLTASALAAQYQTSPSVDGNTQVVLTYIMVAGTTSATTFKVRCGGNGVGTTTFNGRIGARLYGGIIASGITITELTP